MRSCSRSSHSHKPSDCSFDSNEESKRESTESNKGTGSTKPALNQALVIPNNPSSSLLRRGRTLGAEDRLQEDMLDRLKLIDTAMERAMRNHQEPMVIPDEVEVVDEVQRIVPESIMEHGHAEVGE